jgi:hypothetical protein
MRGQTCGIEQRQKPVGMDHRVSRHDEDFTVTVDTPDLFGLFHQSASHRDERAGAFIAGEVGQTRQVVGIKRPCACVGLRLPTRRRTHACPVVAIRHVARWFFPIAP